MVQLTVSTKHGNAGTRHFPFQGYLGLTPVRVDGIVRTRFDEDQRPILAKSLTVSVRAYESRQGRTGTQHLRLLVDYTQTLWRKPDGQPYAELGELEQAFKITLPKRVAGFSSANYQDYRTFWRLEAVLEHAPQTTVGTRIVKQFDLMLIRYDIPPHLPPPSPPSVAALDLRPPSSTLPTLPHATNKPRAPVLHYNLSTPTYSIGPSDLLFTSLFIRPLDRSVSIRSASLLVERRIDLHEIEASTASVATPSTPSNNALLPIAVSSSLPESDKGRKDMSAFDLAFRSTATLDSTASSNTITSRTPLISPSSSAQPSSPVPPPTPSEAVQPHKTITTTVAAAEGTSFALDKETGVWNKTLSLQWHAARSHAKWAMGETMRGCLGAVSFWVRVKVIVTSPAGTETIELAPREICIVLINDAERRQAQAVFADRLNSSSKSRASTSPSASSSTGPSPMPNLSTSALQDRPPSPSASPNSPFSNAHPFSDAFMPYMPPKSAGAATNPPAASVSSVSSSSACRPLSPSSTPNMTAPANGRASSASANGATSAISKVLPLPSKKKSRRPHTSAGPRESVDVRVGGSVPVPVPMPIPTMGYSNSSSVSGSPDTKQQPHQAHRLSASGGKHSFNDRERDRDRDLPPTPPPKNPTPAYAFENEEKFKTLNTKFTGMNGIGGPGAMALLWNQQQQRLDAEILQQEREREREQERERQDKERDAKSLELIRAWEEELTRIEKASKRGSRDMLGFWSSLGRRKAKATA